MENTINLKKATLEELKVAAYDHLAMIEHSKAQLGVFNQEIASRGQQTVKETKKEECKEKECKNINEY